MEEETEREKQAIAARRDKYNLGNGNKGGAAFNIITLDYERSREGEFLKQRDDAAHVRHLLRSKNVDTLSNAGFNLLNGQDRRPIQVPQHEVYNPPAPIGATTGNPNAHQHPTSKGSQLSHAGAQIFGDGFAGRPIRGMDKQFGKRVASSHHY